MIFPSNYKTDFSTGISTLLFSRAEAITKKSISHVKGSGSGTWIARTVFHELCHTLTLGHAGSTRGRDYEDPTSCMGTQPLTSNVSTLNCLELFGLGWLQDPQYMNYASLKSSLMNGGSVSVKLCTRIEDALIVGLELIPFESRDDVIYYSDSFIFPLFTISCRLISPSDAQAKVTVHLYRNTYYDVRKDTSVLSGNILDFSKDLGYNANTPWKSRELYGLYSPFISDEKATAYAATIGVPKDIYNVRLRDLRIMFTVSNATKSGCTVTMSRAP